MEPRIRSIYRCSFPEKGTLDVLWESLDIIDEEDLKKPEEENLLLEELKSATEVCEICRSKRRV